MSNRRIKTYNGGWVELDCAGTTGVRMRFERRVEDNNAVRVTLADLDKIRREAADLLRLEETGKSTDKRIELEGEGSRKVSLILDPRDPGNWVLLRIQGPEGSAVAKVRRTALHGLYDTISKMALAHRREIVEIDERAEELRLGFKRDDRVVRVKLGSDGLAPQLGRLGRVLHVGRHGVSVQFEGDRSQAWVFEGDELDQLLKVKVARA